jgi:orotate phosphoribosyltransferase
MGRAPQREQAMNWISYADLHADVVSFSAALPRDLAGVVGVPRSGLMAASLLALHRHLPLADTDTFARTGAFYAPGLRLGDTPPRDGKVLLLDDSAFTGRSIDRACEQIRQSGQCSRFEVLRGALYVVPAAAGQLDVFYRIVAMPRVFEWNWLAHQHLPQWMCDLDGVLCRDPPVFDDGGPAYEAAIGDAVPLYLPRRPVGALVSCRLERWRPTTEAWLRRHHVAARELILHPAPSAEARRRRGHYGRWKGEHYGASRCTLFVESSALQAPAIARVAQKPVLCLEDKRLYR